METSKSKFHLLILTGIVLATRIPFLFDGYGHEEDSYGLVVNAWEMHESGHYVASRFPGHPFQEYIYSLIWNQPDWVWNSLSTIFSIIGVVAFYNAIKKTGMNHAFEASLMLAFTPIFFIAGTYSIDYVWSLAFVLLSFWALVSKRFWLCGILLGMAVGCRITSGIFIIPWAMLLFQRMDFAQWRKWMLQICIPSGVIGLLWYVPAYLNYGTGFFDYSDQFPYPPMTKVIYKATLGVFGILGLCGLLYAKSKWLFSKDKSAVNPPAVFSPMRLSWVVIVIIILHVISYLRLPQKAGYMLPVVPFVFMLLIMYSNSKSIRVVTILFVLAPFVLGMNITDGLRGSGASAAAITFNISGQEVSVDALRGPALAEKEKRCNKIEYIDYVCDYLDTTKSHTILICGWWYNQLLIEKRSRPPRYNSYGYLAPPSDELLFYAKCEQVLALKQSIREQHIPEGSLDRAELEKQGIFLDPVNIFYLPEQNLYNDQMFGQDCTDQIAIPFPSEH